MAISDFLEDELGLYQKLVSDGSWKTTDASTAKFDVDEAVSVGLFVIDRIRLRNRALSEASSLANRTVMPREEGEYLIRLYQSWLDKTARLLESIREREERGLSINRADELRRCYREVDSLGFDVETITRSIEDAIEGRVKPLREAADEFRRKRYG
jgi:hypothetical protein